MEITGDEEEIDQIICVCVRLIQIYLEKYFMKTPCMISSQTDNMWLIEVLEGNESCCHNMFKMEKRVFIMLLNDLVSNEGLKGSRNISPAEILGMFMYALGHGVGNRNVQECFQRSGKTVSRYFGEMLDIVYNMAVKLIKSQDPEFRNVPKKILSDSRYMSHFKVCFFFKCIIGNVLKIFLSVFLIYYFIIGLYCSYRWCTCANFGISM